MAYVGWRLDVPPVRVREVATFYTMYRLRPVGRHHIGVCNSVSCWAMGSENILRQCADRLGIRPGDQTKDGQFSLEEVACLASFGTAPALIVNNFSYVENVTPESLDALIAQLRNEPGQAMAPPSCSAPPTGTWATTSAMWTGPTTARERRRRHGDAIATPSPVTADLTVSPVVSGLIGGVTAVSSPVLLGAIGISVSLSVAHTLLVSAVVRPVLIPILAITVTPVTILRRRLDRAD